MEILNYYFSYLYCQYRLKCLKPSRSLRLCYLKHDIQECIEVRNGGGIPCRASTVRHLFALITPESLIVTLHPTSLQATMQNVLCVRLLLHVRLTNAIAMGEHENELSMMVAATTHDPLSLSDPERGRTRNVNAPMRRLRVNE